MSTMNKIKNYLLAGLLVWLPIGITIWIIKSIIQAFDQFLPQQLSTDHLFGLHIPGSGLFVAVIALLITGILAKNFLGQKFLELADRAILHIPFVKNIYKGIKQLSDTLLSDSGNAFKEALLVRFPHGEAWTIAFITGTPSVHVILHDSPDDYINVYVPTTPNPTSGYFMIVHKNDTKKLNMSVDEALRYVLSMGTVDPKKTPKA